MADMVCSKCNVGWQILKHEKYCGYCGCEIFDYSVKWKETPQFYIGDETDTRALPVLVENAGASPLKFEPIQIFQGNAIKLPTSNESFEVKPGKSHMIEVFVDPTQLTTLPEKVTFQIQDPPPNFESEKSLTFQALPLPEFMITPNSVLLSYPKSKKKDTINFKVEFQEEQFAIESIESSNEWITECDLSEAPRNIRLEIDCKKLGAGHHSGTLSFKLRGPSQPIEKQIQIQTKILPEPPTLFVVPEENLEIIQDRKKSHTLTLQNTGEDPLRIRNIVLADSSGLVQLPDLEFPMTIEGGTHQNIEIIVFSVDILPDTYPVKFTIISDCATTSEYQYILNVTVKKREPYPYHLAIDFGTTNSCCAYYDNSSDSLKLIPLEDRDTDDTVNLTLSDIAIMPSSIIYLTKPENGKDYDVGAKAVDARMDSRDGPYYISSVKRWLGFGWRRQFPNNQQWQPLDVVTHILKHIINKAEDYLEQQRIPSKITKCVVTYPTKFDKNPQDALRQAFENIGITDDNLILIDEASAASMKIISEKYETLQNDYRLLVYDFGGGTIDIVLSQVTKKENDITIEPIARDGDPKYGGDDVTQAIVDYVLSEYKRRIAKISPEHNFCIPYFGPRETPPSFGNPDIDNATHQNAAALYTRAEEMKKEFDTPSETEFTLDLNVVEDTPQPLSDFVRNILKERIQDENTLTERTQHILRVKLSENQFRQLIAPALNKTFAMIDTMIADNGNHLPNLIVLAGQSSRMRFVKEMMAAHFKDNHYKDIEIRLDKHPKTCVVMGAAEYSLTRSLSDEEGGGIQINLENKTHTRLGIRRRRGFQRIFGEIIPKGKLIPDESYGLTNFPLETWLVPIEVLEHFGSDDSLDLDHISPIGSYNLDLPQDISNEALQKAKLKMAVELNGEITLTAMVGDNEYPYTVQRVQPEFVDEIPRTTPVINTETEPQTISPYQREAEETIRDAQQRVIELVRNYQEGEPIDLDNIFTSTPSQKALLNLNTIARDLCHWRSELNQTGPVDLLQKLTYAKKTIKDKLKTIRGEEIPSPKTLDPPTDVRTETELTRIRNECDDYVVKFEGILRKYELEREVNPSICEQFIKNQIFNNLARFMPSDALSEKLDKFLQLVDWEIVPIKIGETQANSLVHEVQRSRQTGVKRGTIAEVIQPGLKRKSDSAIVQKPVVIRGE